MLLKIGVVGESESVLPFQMLGWEVACCDELAEARAAITRMAQAGFGIIYVTSTLADGLPEIIAQYAREKTPVVTLLPSHRGRDRLARRRLEDMVSRAIGKNIL